MESHKTIHNTYKYLVCNICQEEEIFSTNKSGVCTMCKENRVQDKIWSEMIAYNENLRTDENGCPLLIGYDSK